MTRDVSKPRAREAVRKFARHRIECLPDCDGAGCPCWCHDELDEAA